MLFRSMMLYGTEFKDPEFRKKFGYKTKYRIVPLNYGLYEGTKVLDYEEVAIATKDISFDDYLELRGLALMVEVWLNGRPFEELFIYAESLGINKTQILMRILEEIDSAPEEIKKIHEDFIEETRNELWDSEDELVKHYNIDSNYKKLAGGEIGGNLIYKYKMKFLVHTYKTLLKHLEKVIKDLVVEVTPSKRIINEQEIDNLSRFCFCKMYGFFSSNNNNQSIAQEFDYDIINWTHHPGEALADFKSNQTIRIEFQYTDTQRMTFDDLLIRYGSDCNAFSKIATRMGSLENLFRKVKIGTSDFKSIYSSELIGQDFTKYTLSN